MSFNSGRRITASLLIGLSIVALSLYGFYLHRSRPGLPASIPARDLIRADGLKIEHPKDLEFFFIQKSAGDSATFEFRKDGATETVRAQLVAFYSRVPYPLIYLFIGLFCYLIGFLALGLKGKDPRARVLYWLALIFSYPLIVNGGTYCLRHEWTSFLPAGLFYFLYPLAPAMLLHFSLTFSDRPRRRELRAAYFLSLLFGACFVALILASTFRGSIGLFRTYVSVFQVFRAYMIVLLLFAIFGLVSAYRRAIFDEKRAQIKWVFLGLALGLGPFIFIHQLPALLGLRTFLTEESAALFFIFIPLGFALSIFKFRLFDVDIVINRSLVYSLLTVFTVSLYLFSVRVFQDLFAGALAGRERAVSLAGVFLAALAFQPAQRRIQRLVDRAFFRQGFDYQKTILHFTEASQKVLRREEAVDLLTRSIQSVIPMERLSVWIGEARGFPAEAESPAFLDWPQARIWARPGAARTEAGVDFSKDAELAQMSAEVVLSLPFPSAELKGFIVLGKKRSGQRYSRDDFELFLTLTDELALSLERIKLQEEVIYERASREKLHELNRLKTEFISTVSHELRTPLTSIQGVSEILQEGKVKDKAKREELLGVVAAESARVSRLVHNILDFGKIEQQRRVYHFAEAEIGPLVEEAVRVLRPALDGRGFAVRLDLPPQAVRLRVDADAVKQALLNLIDNAIKYSPARKEIDIRLLERPHEVEFEVSDRGIGLSPEAREKIFEPFYRAPEAAEVNPKGVGLGLKIVRHIVAAHRGEIQIDSRPGGGTTVRLIFPRE